MLPITEELIASLAPNPAAISNAKKISQKGDFFNLGVSGDETFIRGECRGSGKIPYVTSADFVKPGEPVFRCSCPSRQFPCKHALALMYEYLRQKPFAACEIPPDILEKREKLEKRREASGAPKETGAKKPVKQNTAALAKKMARQLEGLTLAEQLLRDLLEAGLTALSGSSIQSYKALAKQMGDYYLPGPQALINGILLGLERMKQNPGSEEEYYRQVIASLVELQATIKKARVFLAGKMEGGNLSMEDSMLYDQIGYIWQLSQLDELGLYQDNVQLVQLSFSVQYDEARAEYVDTGYWINLGDGVISKKENLRPVKALKYIKQDDTALECLQIPRLYFYPGEINKRVRWDAFTTRPVTKEDLAAIRSWARDSLPAVVKEAKNQVKNALSEKTAVFLLSYRRVGKVGDAYVLEDHQGNTVMLADYPGGEPVVDRLVYLPGEACLHEQAMACQFFYDAKAERIAAVPLAIVTENQILRLLY